MIRCRSGRINVRCGISAGIFTYASFAAVVGNIFRRIKLVLLIMIKEVEIWLKLGIEPKILHGT